MLLDYCLNNWEDVKNDIDINNLTKLDKILLLSREWDFLGINSFQCWGNPCKYLNKIFGLKEKDYSYNIGVQSVWISGASYNFAPRIPRVRIEYKKGGDITYVVVIGDKILPKNTNENVYRFATEKEIDEFISYMEQMIVDRKTAIESQSNNPSLQELLHIFKEYVNSYLNNSFTCNISYGKSQADNENYYALVIKERNCQIGYIIVSLNQYKEINLEIVAPLSGRYNCSLKDWKNEYKTILTNACYYILN